MVNQITDRLHVGASGRDVIREAWMAFTVGTRRSKAMRQGRHEFYIACLKRHVENQVLYCAVMRGM